MASVLPVMTEQELVQLARKSPAEAAVYRRCLTLPERWVVLHGLRAIVIEPGEGPRDREGDFVFLHPSFGMLVVEVKGGQVRFRQGRWQRRLDGIFKPIKDPFAQALGMKHALLSRLRERMEWEQIHAAWGGARMLARHAVLLPDVRDSRRVRGPQIEAEIVGGSDAVDELESWVERAFRFGASEHTWHRLEDTGVRVVRDILANEFSTSPILAFKVHEAERQRLQLTRQQYRVAVRLKVDQALAVAGGAGTGKTVLALTHARQSSTAGIRTLLMCFNTALATSFAHERQRWLGEGLILGEHLVVSTIDRFARSVVGQIRSETGADYRAEAVLDYPDVRDKSLLDAVAMEHALRGFGLPFRVFERVIIDEGQDFGDAHWLALQLVLQQADRVAVFFDPNQAIYRVAEEFPIATDDTMFLTRNCRTTDPIHEIAYRGYRGEPMIEASGLVGDQPEFVSVRGSTRQARRIANLVKELRSERIEPHMIAILVMDSQGKSNAYRALSKSFGQAFEGEELLGVEQYGQPGKITVDTVGRFKGLEAEVVVLWVNGHCVDEEEMLFYVGLSRAKTFLWVVGHPDAISGLQVGSDASGVVGS